MLFRKSKKEAQLFSFEQSERILSNDNLYDTFEREFYGVLRKNIPVLDAAITKIVRLVGDFTLVCSDKRYQKQLDDFASSVKVGYSGQSIYTFIDSYLDSLLTYGCSIGEVLVDKNAHSIVGLYNGDSTKINACAGSSPTQRKLTISTQNGEMSIKDSSLILYSTINPSSHSPNGEAILSGLSSLCDILMRIYRCIGQNFDRVGNVRYAVTYKPSGDLLDKNFAVDRAKAIAKEWSDGMNSSKYGVIKDFVAVGDVDIKVIGADNQVIDTNIPVRQILEQIVSKLSIPPFLLGLNWNSTERMSAQQSDILTSELEYFRRLLNPIIRQICTAFCVMSGIDSEVEIKWANINLQDECDLALARLTNAQAKTLEEKLEKEVR